MNGPGTPPAPQPQQPAQGPAIPNQPPAVGTPVAPPPPVVNTPPPPPPAPADSMAAASPFPSVSPAAPGGSVSPTQGSAIKHGGSGKLMPVLLAVGIIIFLVAYTFVWVYVFKLQLPFLPQF